MDNMGFIIQTINIILPVMVTVFFVIMAIGWLLIRRRTGLPYAVWGIVANVCLVALMLPELMSLLGADIIIELRRSSPVLTRLVITVLLYIGLVLNVIVFLRLVAAGRDIIPHRRSAARRRGTSW